MVFSYKKIDHGNWFFSIGYLIVIGDILILMENIFTNLGLTHTQINK